MFTSLSKSRVTQDNMMGHYLHVEIQSYKNGSNFVFLELCCLLNKCKALHIS